METLDGDGDWGDSYLAESTTSQQVVDNGSPVHQRELQETSSDNEQENHEKQLIIVKEENNIVYSTGDHFHQSRQCKCRQVTTRAYTCGGCLKTFSTICNLHKHLDNSHTDSELYFFDKVTQTAFPRYGTACKATQTETQIIQNAIVVRQNEGLGVNTKKSNELRNNGMENIDLSSNDVRIIPDKIIKTEPEYAVGGAAYMVTSTYPGEYLEEREVDDIDKVRVEHEFGAEDAGESDASDVTIKVEMPTDDNDTFYNDDTSDSPSQKTRKTISKTKLNKNSARNERKGEKQSILKMHKKTKPLKTNIQSCHICEKKFTTLYRLKRHLEIHKTLQSYVCEVCERAFTSSKRRDIHLATHNISPPSGTYTCNVCEKTYTSSQKLNRHKTDIHSDGKIYMCQHCGLICPTQYLLKRHIRRCLNIRPYKCTHENCDKRYTTHDSLKVHYRNHTGELPFVCEICGNKYRCRSRLTKHKLIHSEERPLKCDQCPKAFNSKDKLRRHRLTHRESKPCVCECGKAFTNNWNLKAHQRQHNNDRPYSCDVCGESFKHNVSKKNHMKVHADLLQSSDYGHIQQSTVYIP